MLQQYKFPSTVWDVDKELNKNQEFLVNLYTVNNPEKIIIWLPGMSDKPLADKDNPLLEKFIKEALIKNYTVAVVAFPGTAGNGFIEQRTMSGLRQNVQDTLKIISQKVKRYASLEKILIGRSASGTLLGSLINQDFSKGIVIAGRLRTKKLYDEVINDPVSYPRIKTDKGQELYVFGSLQDFMSAQYVYLDSDGSKKYCQNSKYLDELKTEEELINENFAQLASLQNKQYPKLLAIQAQDDEMVPLQLSSWQELAQKNDLEIDTFTIDYQCGHKFNTQPAVTDTVQKIWQFIN